MRKRKYTAVFILAEITGLSGDRQKLTARVTSQGEHHHKEVVLDLDQKFRFEITTNGVTFSKTPDASSVEVGTEVVFVISTDESDDQDGLGKLHASNWGLAESYRRLRHEEAQRIQREKLDRKPSQTPPRPCFGGFTHI